MEQKNSTYIVREIKHNDEWRIVLYWDMDDEEYTLVYETKDETTEEKFKKEGDALEMILGIVTENYGIFHKTR